MTEEFDKRGTAKKQVQGKDTIISGSRESDPQQQNGDF
jgi:hypothetical protein